MVNALIDRANFTDVSSVATGIEVVGDKTIIPTDELDVIDTLDDGIVLSVIRANRCDINADTMIHTPLNTQIPLSITDLNNCKKFSGAGHPLKRRKHVHQFDWLRRILFGSML